MKHLIYIISFLLFLSCSDDNDTALVRNALLTGEVLRVGEQLTSSNGQFKLKLEINGELKLLNSSNETLWTSGSSGGSAASFLKLQLNGDVVLWKDETLPQPALWHTNTFPTNNGDEVFILQNNGDLVLWNDNTYSQVALWASNTIVNNSTP
jgi:hypothetical protein